MIGLVILIPKPRLAKYLDKISGRGVNVNI
jgi:hypothetical protein